MNSFIHLSIIVVGLFRTGCAEDNYIKVEAVSGQSTELPCNVTAENEDDSISILAWFRNGSATAFYSRDWREGGQSTPRSGRYRLVTSETDEYKLQIVTVSASDAGSYTCLVDFFASPSHKTHVELVVIEPSQYLWVVDENDTQVAAASIGVNMSQNIGPYYIGDMLELACIAFEGKPVATPQWWTERRHLKSTLSSLSEQRVLNILTYGPLQREDHGRVFTCLASNNDNIAPLTIDITIDMHLPPDLVALHIEGADSSTRNGRVHAGETISMQCRVLGARPLPPLQWLLAGKQLEDPIQNITMEPSQRLLVSELQLPIKRSYDESDITCCAPDNLRGSENLTCAQVLPLTVLYPPVLEIVVADQAIVNNTLAVVKGSSISLGCNYEANPSLQELSWFYKDDLMDNPGDVRNPIQSVLELKDMSEDNAGEYACVATNDEGRSFSEPVFVDIIYPAYCEDTTPSEYGIAENDGVNLTCVVKAHPEPSSYRWVIVENPNATEEELHNSTETDQNSLLYTRPNGTSLSIIYCWGQNEVPTEGLVYTPCMFKITDKTIPRPPKNCEAKKNALNEIVVSCEKGHDGGLPQKFKFTAQLENSGEQLVSIINLEPHFMFEEPQEEYKLMIVAFNEKGESKVVEITTTEKPGNTIKNITTLSLSLCGAVLLVALVACGLVLFTHERSSRLDLPRDRSDPPLCAYNTEESNCETYRDSDDGSENNMRRTESFRRAVRRPSKNFDVRRTSSFHSARYMNDMVEQDNIKYIDMPRHSNACRVHSLQNINRKKEMDTLCDHLVLHLPPETNYNVPRPMNTFYTMPRKMRHKLAKELSDDHSEITQASDGFSLPPPPDEYGTYRAGTRIRDVPKMTPTYTTVIRNNSTGRETKTQPQYNQTMNTTGLPTISGGQHSVYSYPDDEHHSPQVSTNPFGEDSS